MNIRLMEGQGGDPLQHERDALARAAALQALQAIAEPDPAAMVGYRSSGRTLVVGNAAHALPWADHLAAVLPVTAILTDGDGTEPSRAYPVFAARAVALSGWLGAFQARWQAPGQDAREERFDLVFDLCASPLVITHQKPHGYYAPGPDEAARRAAADAIAGMTGEFEKPRYFAYKERLCAHSRNMRTGCNACVDICSAGAIGGAGDGIKVNPYLCAGCGACTTVCPTGALGYAYPSAADTGSRIKAALRSYREAGGTDPAILFYGSGEGAALLESLGGQDAPALPGRVIPYPLHHIAATGIDLWLAALAWGASGIAVLATGAEAPQYADALEQQMTIGQAVMDGLGYAGTHFRLLRASDPASLARALALAPRGTVAAEPGTFNAAADKRNTLDYALEHLHRHSPAQPREVALPAGAPFGAVAINRDACSLCMACAGACPSSALMDGQDLPQLRFVEQNCVQCGLCADTCPERAITLVPRIGFDDSRRQAVVLNASQPFHCIRCDKPFGTLQMIENMLARLSQHEAFAGNLDRLRMCGDCRVIDMMMTKEEAVVELRRR